MLVTCIPQDTPRERRYSIYVDDVLMGFAVLPRGLPLRGWEAFDCEGVRLGAFGAGGLVRAIELLAARANRPGKPHAA